MGTAADYTLIVLIVALGVGLWSVFDRLGQIERDLAALKKKLGVVDEAQAAPHRGELPVRREP
jgi:hypothetical protein